MKALQAGAKAYILKPISETSLGEAIANIYSSNIKFTDYNQEYLLDD